MGVEILKASVMGNSHKKAENPVCQDNCDARDRNFKYKSGDKNAVLRSAIYGNMPEDVTLVAVADGHGSKSCPYSEYGSRVAVNIFCDIMAEYCSKESFKQDREALIQFLSNEADTMQLARVIDREWKGRVYLDYNSFKKKQPPLDDIADEEKRKAAIYKLYGSTLLGMVITDDFIFAFQLGDGDITLVSKNVGAETFIEQEKILGVETHSISKIDAWKKVVTRLIKRDEYPQNPSMFMLSTDGMANSFISEEEFHKSCIGYLDSIIEYGVEAIRENLPSWLDQTSIEGCGDDTTVVMAYFTD